MTIIRTLFEDRSRDELGLLLLFVVVATYMFIAAGSYPDIIGLYPRLLAGIVLVTALLLLFQNLLPEPLREYVTEPGAELGSSTEVSDELPEEGERPAGGATEDATTSRAQVVLTLLVTGYLLLSYLIGMYFATPVFVLTYGVVFSLDWKITLGLTTVISGVAHVFLVVFDAPITSGVLL